MPQPITDRITVGAARRRYFDANGFGDGGYTARWVKLQAGPVPLFFPNTAARVRAVRLHDIHHVVTSYATTWVGEAEIGAWEIASGCADHYAAWLLNLQAMAIGLCLNPRAIRHAFIRGRHTGNLYRWRELDEATLAMTVGALRAELRLERAIPDTTATDRALFAAWALASLATLLLTAAPITITLVVLARAFV